MNSTSASSAKGNERAFRSLSYILVFLMMVCAVITIGNLIQALAPHWHSGIIASVLLFIVIDRLYTYRHLKTLTLWSSEWMIGFGAQWILILLLTRFLLSYASGIDVLRTDLLLLARGYVAELFTPEYVGTFLLAFLLWFFTGRFLYLLDEVGLDHVLASQENSASIQREAVPAHHRLMSLTFSIGIGLVILTALARVDYQVIVSNVEGLPPLRFNRLTGGEAGALLYFVFGLALLSLSRLMSLHSHWNQLRIPVSSRNLYRQWGVYSVVFLLSLAVIVSLLPAGDSLGFFSVLGTLFDFLIGVLLLIGQLILTLVMLLFSLPFFLLGQELPALRQSVPPPMPVLPPAPPASPSASSAIWLQIRSILLWGSIVTIVVFVSIQFVRQHGGIRAALSRSRLRNWLVLAWQWLYRNADQARDNLSRAITDGWQNIVARLEGKRVLPRLNLIRLRSLDPRGQISFFYLAMIRRAAEQGLARKPSQTPSEYAVSLEKSLPSAGEDIDSITDAFIEARYSRKEVDSRQAGMVKATWARIRRAIQSKAKSEQSRNR